MRYSKKKIFGILIIILLTANKTHAQDTHYWTQQFGTRSALMGGIVIGGARDNTMIYYNPAVLGFIDSSSVSVNASAYRLENIKIENAIGQSADFKSGEVGIIPLVVAGMFTKQKKKLKIGYAFVSPLVFNFKATARLDNFINIADDAESAGNEEFIGQQSINSSLREDMLVIGMGQKLNENWSLGIGHLFTLRSHSYTKASLSRFFLNDANNSLVTSSALQSFSYYHIRYAIRLSLAYSKNNFDAGVTITPPGLRIMGTGTVAADITATNINFKGLRQDLLATDRQPELKSKFRSPLSFSAGFNIHLKRSLLAFSSQYFGSESIYDILRAEPAAFVRPASLYPSLGSENFLRVKTGAKSVLNMGIAYEYFAKDGLSLVASIRNDMSYLDKDLVNQVGIKPDVASWDIYHLVIGGTRHKGRSYVSLGFMLGLGNDKARLQTENYTSVSELNFLQGTIAVTKAKYSLVGAILGYSFNLK